MAWQDRAYNREGGSFGGGGGVQLGFPAPTPMALGVMAACFVLFLLQAFSPAVTEYGSLTFAGGLAFRQPWRWLTYQYLHGNPSHIFWNLLWIYFFLPPLERLWGPRRAFAFYTLGGIAAGATFGIMSTFLRLPHPLIGASGSIMAAVGAVACLFPEMSIWLLVISIPIRALAVLYAVWYTLTIAWSHNLSDAAHLGGLAFGFLAPLYAAPLWSGVQRKLHRAQVKRQVDLERADEELVDRILQKVHDTGMNSLTRWERRALKKATERQRLAEVSRARKGF